MEVQLAALRSKLGSSVRMTDHIIYLHRLDCLKVFMYRQAQRLNTSPFATNVLAGILFLAALSRPRCARKCPTEVVNAQTQANDRAEASLRTVKYTALAVSTVHGFGAVVSAPTLAGYYTDTRIYACIYAVHT